MDEQLEKLKALLGKRYEIKQKLGEGGMAVVYLARDLKHDRDVAIKTLRPELAASIGAERFLQEIRVTAKLNHPHVLALYDSGEANGVLYYVMPFVKGESLRDLINREQQLSIDDATRIAHEVAEALAHAHRQGLIHRDIKPENILLSEGHAVVADFGISRAVSVAGGARLTQTGLAIGTPAYMSPEQSAGDPNLDARSDIYSLGCVLFEMLVGQIPFPAPSLQAMMARHSIEKVSPPSVMRPSIPEALEETILRALAKNPADRFRNASHFAAAISAAQSGTAAPATSLRPAVQSWRRRAVRLTGAAATLLGTAALAWWLAIGRTEPPVLAVAAERGEGVTSIAVLPFENASTDPSNEYFADGLTDELADVLSDIEGIRVAGRRSTRAFKSTSVDPRTIGQQLDVQVILEGSVRKSGNRVTIDARLIDARNGFQLWHEQYDRTVSDVFAVQEDIARSLVAELQGELQGERDLPTVVARTTDAMAHDKYLWGQFNLNRRTEEGALDAIDNFTMAIGFDSAFADAYAGLADAQLAHIDYSTRSAESGVLEAARTAAEVALDLDPDLGRARRALGWVKFHAWDWSGAQAEYDQALATGPNDPVVRQRYAELLATVGRTADALLHARVAVEQDRLSTSALHTLLRVRRAGGQYSEAIRAGQEILKLNPNEADTWLDIGMLFVVAGRPGDAADALERYAELRGGNAEAFTTFAESAARFAQHGVASRVPPPVIQLTRSSPVRLAVLHQLVGDSGEALSVLERAHRVRHPDLTNLTIRPELTPIREAPRFRAILADLGLTSR